MAVIAPDAVFECFVCRSMEAAEFPVNADGYTVPTCARCFRKGAVPAALVAPARVVAGPPPSAPKGDPWAAPLEAGEVRFVRGVYNAEVPEG